MISHAPDRLAPPEPTALMDGNPPSMEEPPKEQAQPTPPEAPETPSSGGCGGVEQNRTSLEGGTAAHGKHARPGTPPDAAPPVTRPGDTVIGWPWFALARPASIPANKQQLPGRPSGNLPGVLRSATDWTLLAAADGLRRLLDRPVEITGTDQAQPLAEARHEFGIAFDLGDQSQPLTLLFDAQAARLLVGPLAEDAAALRSPAEPGPVARLSPAERGLLEYVVLATLDSLAKRANTSGMDIRLRAFQSASEVASDLRARTPGQSLPLRLTVGAQTGTLWLVAPQWSPAQWAVLQRSVTRLGRRKAMPEALEVRLALPPVTLTLEEAQRSEPGDVLLLGGADLTSLPGPCHLVTPTHWQLSPARLVQDTPTYLRVETGPCRPQAAPLAAEGDANSGGGKVVIRPLLGRASVPFDQLPQWREGTALTLAKDAAAPVDLFVGASHLARGELVILGSELGIRIVERQEEKDEEKAVY